MIPALYNNFSKGRLPDKDDPTLFTRSDGIQTGWRLIDPILPGWESSAEAPPLVSYKPGSWGPAEADDLLARGDHQWRLGCGGHEE